MLFRSLWVPAWAAVVLLDFFVFRRGRYQAQQLTRGRAGAYWYLGGFRWQSLIAWLVGVLASIPFVAYAQLPWMTAATAYQGPIAQRLGGADISGIVGAVVAGVVYYAVRRLTLSRAETVGEQVSPTGTAAMGSGE